MSPALTGEQVALFDMAYAYGQERIAPFAADWEREGTIPRDALADAGPLGFGGLYVSPEDGGVGLNRADAALVFEALAMACPSVAAFISIHNMCAHFVARHGTERVRNTHLSELVSMGAIASYCLTEPYCGSDAAALRTRAVKDGTDWVLNGAKAFISGGGYSDLYVVMCRTGGSGASGISAIAVPADASGLSFGAPERKMGWRAQPTSLVQFDDCRVPESYLLGQEGRGFTYAMQALDGGRINIAACSLGGAQRCLDAALRYAGQRQAFGRTIDQFQSIQFKLADMATSLQAARLMLHDAAHALDAGSPQATVRCAMAKRFVTDAAFEAANDALQIHGGYGYLEDFGIEKIVRDLRVHQILEGTNEIMRLIVSRALMEARSA